VNAVVIDVSELAGERCDHVRVMLSRKIGLSTDRTNRHE
jgi:hypothetical protein